MPTKLIIYGITAALFFGLDFLWLSLSLNPVYKKHLGGLLLDKPNLPVAGLFYLFYVIGIVIFAVYPAIDIGDWQRAAWAGALLGLMAYGTYDMTNLATIRGWPAVVSLIDLGWGTFATAAAATASYFISRTL